MARGAECIYEADPDTTRMKALKRKHDVVKREADEIRELLSQLKSVSTSDAYKIIDFLRDNEGLAPALDFVRALPAPGAPAERLFSTYRDQNIADGSLTPVPYGGYSSSATVALDLNAGRDRHDMVPPRGLKHGTSTDKPSLPSISSLL